MRILAGRLPPAYVASLRQAIGPEFAHTDHVLHRMASKGVTMSMLLGCLESGRIIEVHNEAGTLRAMLRDATGVCAVVDLHNRTVVTTYVNAASDRHNTLDRASYYWGPIGRKQLAGLSLEKS